MALCWGSRNPFLYYPKWFALKLDCETSDRGFNQPLDICLSEGCATSVELGRPALGVMPTQSDNGLLFFPSEIYHLDSTMLSIIFRLHIRKRYGAAGSSRSAHNEPTYRGYLISAVSDTHQLKIQGIDIMIPCSRSGRRWFTHAVGEVI